MFEVAPTTGTIRPADKKSRRDVFSMYRRSFPRKIFHDNPVPDTATRPPVTQSSDKAASALEVRPRSWRIDSPRPTQRTMSTRRKT